MPVETTATNAASGFASRALLWLELLTLTIGVLQFAFAPTTVERPLVAIVALAFLSISILVYTVPALQRPPSRQHWIGIVALVLCVTLLCLATGAARSALVTLYVIPLAVVALAFGRWWLVALLAVGIAVLTAFLGALTPGLIVRSADFPILVFNRLVPGLATALILATLIEQMRSAVQRISDLAATDPLTGLLNLRSFEEVLQQEHRKAERFGRPYTLVVIDVDNMAYLNEKLGHEAGSQVLVSVAAAITRSVRASDVAARLGGDDFVVLLTEADDATGGAIAQRMRHNIYAGTISVANRLIRANASVGMATFPQDHLYPKELMILADQRMKQDRELRSAQA
jgi:diguanylate cyclase (GGDEF)-like protein